MTELPEVLPATGTAGLAWLLFALPALGAVVLLLAGRRADRWGHWLGVATVAGAFVIGLLIFFDTLALDPDQRTRELSPATRIEILTPDFRGRMDRALEILQTARPDVMNHNLETAPRLYKEARPGSDYAWSLNLLKRFKAFAPEVPTKSVGAVKRR